MPVPTAVIDNTPQQEFLVYLKDPVSKKILHTYCLHDFLVSLCLFSCFT